MEKKFNKIALEFRGAHAARAGERVLAVANFS